MAEVSTLILDNQLSADLEQYRQPSTPDIPSAALHSSNILLILVKELGPTTRVNMSSRK
jgi:hypothetical protein